MLDRLVTPRDFLQNPEASERIIATETEYTVRRPDGSVPAEAEWRDGLTSLEAIRALGDVAAFSTPKYCWLSNGAELHQDLGHMEWCTAESLGPYEATATSHAGARAIKRLALASGSELKIYRRSATVDPVSGVVESQGYHPNFCIPLEVADTVKLSPLETHMTTLFYGSGGMVTKDGFSIAPKAPTIGRGITKDMNTRTGHSKPFALVRTPGAGGGDNDVNNYRDGFARLEGRCFTPSTRWSDFMALGTTSMLLRVIEHRDLREEHKQLKELRLKDSVAAFQLMGKDVAMTQVFELLDGRTMTAINIQSRLCEIAQSTAQKINLPDSEKLCLAEWEAICEEAGAVAKKERSLKLIQRIGWVAKYGQLTKVFDEESLRGGDDLAIAVCLGMDQIAPKGPVYEIFEQRFVPEIIRDEDVEQFVTQPPQGTRAKVRSDYILYPSHLRARVLSMNWPTVKYARGTQEFLDIMHPYQTEPGYPHLVNRN
jgi:proteasome accessory factor A